jgi:hypothetical protein
LQTILVHLLGVALGIIAEVRHWLWDPSQFRALLGSPQIDPREGLLLWDQVEHLR